MYQIELYSNKSEQKLPETRYPLELMHNVIFIKIIISPKIYCLGITAVYTTMVELS